MRRRSPTRKSFAVRLEWPGRAWEPGHTSTPHTQAELFELVPPLENPLFSPEPRLLLGRAEDTASMLLAQGARAKLIYIDPPFLSQADYISETRLDGTADGRVVRALAYEDRDDVAGYLSTMAPTLEKLTRLLAEDGTLWVHLDWRAAYLVRVLLDEILGPDQFLNEVVWRRAPNLGRQAKSHQFGRTLDTLVVYGKTKKATLRPPTRLEPIEERAVRHDESGRAFTSAPRGDYTDKSIAKLEEEGRIHRTKSGKVYIKYFLVKDETGQYCRERPVDTLWTDIAPLRHVPLPERTGYPTQKPRALLERIVRASTDPGDLVVDLFSGSGTTAEASFLLGRRVIAGDASELAVATTRARLLRAGSPLRVELCGKTWAVTPGLSIERSQTQDGVSIELKSPREPLAWSISNRGALGPVTVWHAERSLGSLPAGPSSSARLRSSLPSYLIRAFANDGTLYELSP